LTGELQSWNAPPSTWHWRSALESFVEKLNEALRLDVAEPFAGPEEMVTVGGAVSIVNDRDLIELTLPAASVALVKNVWAPSDWWASLYVGPQGAKGAEPTWHSKVEPIWFDLMVKVGVGLLVTPPSCGPLMIVAIGGVVSAVKLLKI